jgi:hypothetical protein
VALYTVFAGERQLRGKQEAQGERGIEYSVFADDHSLYAKHSA